MNYLADRAHDRADNQFDILRSRCFDNRDLCALDGSGRYSDAGTEELYQASLRYDGHARRWLFAGETALVGAAAMFVYELTRHAPKKVLSMQVFKPEGEVIGIAGKAE